MGNRESAIYMLDITDTLYQEYVKESIKQDGDNNRKAAFKIETETSCAKLINHLLENFPNPADMDDDQRGALLEETNKILYKNHGDIINDVSDVAFPIYIMRLALFKKKIIIFNMVDEWKDFSKRFNVILINGMKEK